MQTEDTAVKLLMSDAHEMKDKWKWETNIRANNPLLSSSCIKHEHTDYFFFDYTVAYPFKSNLLSCISAKNSLKRTAPG